MKRWSPIFRIVDVYKRQVDNMVEVKERILPSEVNKEIYEKGYRMYRKLFEDLTDCFEE